MWLWGGVGRRDPAACRPPVTMMWGAGTMLHVAMLEAVEAGMYDLTDYEVRGPTAGPAGVQAAMEMPLAMLLVMPLAMAGGVRRRGGGRGAAVRVPTGHIAW